MSLRTRSRGRVAAFMSLALASLAAALLSVWPAAALNASAKKLHGPHGGGGVSAPWTVGKPVTYRNLTIFPVRARNLNARAVSASDAYITLDEGIKQGTVVITEKGAAASSSQTARRGGRPFAGNNQQAARQQQVALTSDNASVNQLALINRSGKKLLLLSGEVIVGGKQDRIVEEDRIVPAVSVPVSLNVFCVEHGRWSARSGGGVASSNSRTQTHGSRTEVASPVAANSFTSLGAISHPKLRAAAQDKKQQGEVWKEVSANNTRLGTSNGTDTYQEVYTSGKVGAQMGDYVSALAREVLTPDTVGVVIARNGELVWADCFASPALFAKYWPKLLKSYVVDALGDQRSDKVPTTAEAQKYLYERAGASGVAGMEGVYRLTKTEHAGYAIFELEDISLAAPFRLHFNKMGR